MHTNFEVVSNSEKLGYSTSKVVTSNPTAYCPNGKPEVFQV